MGCYRRKGDSESWCIYMIDRYGNSYQKGNGVAYCKDRFICSEWTAKRANRKEEVPVLQNGVYGYKE